MIKEQRISLKIEISQKSQNTQLLLGKIHVLEKYQLLFGFDIPKLNLLRLDPTDRFYLNIC